MSRQIYLDHNATTPLGEDVLQEMLPFLGDRYGNPSSIHAAGQQALRALDRARRRVAAFVGAEPAEIVFTASGTEADNLALRGVVEPRLLRGAGAHVVTTAVEHPAVLETCKALSARGARVTYLPVDGHGRVDPRSVSDAMTDDTAVVSVMLVSITSFISSGPEIVSSVRSVRHFMIWSQRSFTPTRVVAPGLGSGRLTRFSRFRSASVIIAVRLPVTGRFTTLSRISAPFSTACSVTSLS